MTLITSFFSRATPEQVQEQDRRGLEQIQHANQWKKAHEIVESKNNAQRKREAAAKRQRKHRQRIALNEVSQGLRDPETMRLVKPMKLVRERSPEPLEPNNHPPNKKQRASPINHFEPTRWAIITRVAKRVGFSHPQLIATELRKGPNGDLFQTLQGGTVAHWINKERTGWTDKVKERVSRVAEAHKKSVSPIPHVANEGKILGRPARLAQYPSVLNNIVQLLSNIRRTGCLVTRSVAQGVTLAFILADAPKLFHDPRFKCSDAFIRRLLRTELNWKWRKVTQDASKLPADWEDQCLDFAHRLTWNIKLHNIPPELVINADQTGVSYLGTGAKTWELKGSDQISAVGQEEKRQFTLMVAITAAGQTLPYQAIYKGRTADSLPSAQAQKLCEALRFIFTSGGNKHWSSLESMKIWVLEVLVPFIERERRRLNLSYRQKAILLLDCWAVHRGEPFRKWLKSSFPWLIVLYVPGGCTSVAQPCDTGVNRPLKHRIKSSCIEWLSETTQKQLRRGIKPESVVFDSTPATLRNASVGWLTNSWEWLRDHPQVVLDAWRRAEFKGWNLSYGFLTSAANQATVEDRFYDDQQFALTVIDNRLVSEDSEFEEEDTPDYDDDYAIDPLILARIRQIQLPDDITEHAGDLVYTGDEVLTDSENDLEREDE